MNYHHLTIEERSRSAGKAHTGHRNRGATRALPAADAARGASGRGRCATQPLKSARRTPGTATGEHLSSNTQDETLCCCQYRTQ